MSSQAESAFTNFPNDLFTPLYFITQILHNFTQLLNSTWRAYISNSRLNLVLRGNRYSRALGNQTREGFNILSRRVSITRVKRAQNVNGSNIPNWISKKGGRNVFRGEDFARIMVSGRIQWRKPRSPFIKKPPSPPRDKISRENRRVGRRYIDGKIRYPRRQPFHRWRGESNRKIFDNNEFGLSVDPNRKWISIWIYIYIYEQYNGWSTRSLKLYINYTIIIYRWIY